MFIDWAGPGVYVVMFLLAGWMVYKAGWSNIDFTLADVKYTGWAAVWQMIVATRWSSPTSPGRWSTSATSRGSRAGMDAVRKGNFWGCRSTSSPSRSSR